MLANNKMLTLLYETRINMTEKITLSNGMRLLVEYIPGLRSVSTGLWIKTGSAREERGQYGVSHLLEHMLFKGTKNRTALQISAAMDDVGGILNAFTAKEITCFYTRCLDEQFTLSLELLSDMYHNSLFDPEATEREKSVVIEEINMYTDEPDERAHELFAATLWPQHPYGHSISGTAADVASLSATDVRQYWQQHYNTAETVLAVAGHVEPQQVAELAEKLFSNDTAQTWPELPVPEAASGDAYLEKDIEQSHICMGFPAISIADADYYAAAIVNSSFGGSSSSRLFQEVREKRGLSYSPYSGLETLNKGGFFMAYSSTQPDRADELVEVMSNEFARLATNGLSSTEINRSKEQMKGALMLSLESSSAVMSKLGKHELLLGRIYDPEYTVQQLMAVTEEDINRFIKRVIRPGSMVLAQVGPKPVHKSTRELF